MVAIFTREISQLLVDEAETLYLFKVADRHTLLNVGVLIVVYHLDLLPETLVDEFLHGGTIPKLCQVLNTSRKNCVSHRLQH